MLTAANPRLPKIAEHGKPSAYWHGSRGIYGTTIFQAFPRAWMIDFFLFELFQDGIIVDALEEIVGGDILSGEVSE